MPDLMPYFREGDVLSARVINEIIRRLNEPINLKTQGLSGRVDGNQISIALGFTPIRMAKGKVNSGGLSVRTSDAVHGSGDVTIWAKDLTTGDYAATTEIVTIDTISSTTGGVAAGTWCNIAQHADSHWELINNDCGN